MIVLVYFVFGLEVCLFKFEYGFGLHALRLGLGFGV